MNCVACPPLTVPLQGTDCASADLRRIQPNRRLPRQHHMNVQGRIASRGKVCLQREQTGEGAHRPIERESPCESREA